jgi:hypothetical protein
VYLNNLRGVFEYGISSFPWYLSALRDFLILKKTLKHTPVSLEVEEFYSKDFWSTRKFLGIL